MNKLDLTKPVQTRDGRKVRILCTDTKGAGMFPVYALITEENGKETSATYTLAGQYNLGDRCILDLVNVSNPNEVTIDVDKFWDALKSCGCLNIDSIDGIEISRDMYSLESIGEAIKDAEVTT
jgi:hypothetical protein